MTIYEQITNKILAEIEAGAGEFIMPWHRPSGGGVPFNPSRKGGYRGVNTLVLWIAEREKGYASSNWATFKQWQSLGAQVKKGEKSTQIVFFKPLEIREKGAEIEDSDPVRTIAMAKAYHVFNADQVEGWTAPTIAAPVIPNPVAPLPHVDAFIRATGADVRTGEARAYYIPSKDFINMPERDLFKGSPTSTPTESYYSTLCHELVHWTGAKHRLDRQFGARFGNETYAAEELVAELGAAFLCASLGITNSPRPDHAQYIASWIKVLKSDPRALFTAASKAQAAITYVEGNRQEEAEAA